jgi:hypothetical protein
MLSQIGGLIPLLLRKSTVLPALETVVKIALFYGGLVALRSLSIAVWELVLLSVAMGGMGAFAISSRSGEAREAIQTLGKRSFFLPSAVLVVVGWSLWRWANLPEWLFKAGLTTFSISTVLCLQHLESDLTPETAIVFLQIALFVLFPIVLSAVFNALRLL